MKSNLLHPLRLRDFRLIFSGETVSVLGDQFHFVALAWLTLQLTGSGLALGTVLMVAAIPRVVFMLIGGALSDRWSPRSLMLWSNAIRAVLVGGLSVLVLTGRAELWHLYLLAAGFGIVDALFYPAVGAILPMLVGEDDLPPANALMQGSQQLAGLLGPAAAGVFVALVSVGAAFVLDAVSFAFAAVAILLVAGGRRAAAPQAADPAAAVGSGEANGLFGSIGAGLRYAWGDPAVRSLILVAAAFNFAISGPIAVGLPYLANTRFEGGSAAFGLIFSGFGAGALVGAVLAGSIHHMPRLGTVVLTIGAGLGAVLLVVGMAPNVPIALVEMAVMGLGAGFINVQVVSWLQIRSAEEMRGRVMSLVSMGSAGLVPVSYALAGAIVDFGAVTLMFAVGGLIIIGASALAFAWGMAGQMNAQPSAEPVEVTSEG